MPKPVHSCHRHGSLADTAGVFVPVNCARRPTCGRSSELSRTCKKRKHWHPAPWAIPRDAPTLTPRKAKMHLQARREALPGGEAWPKVVNVTPVGRPTAQASRPKQALVLYCLLVAALQLADDCPAGRLWAFEVSLTTAWIIGHPKSATFTALLPLKLQIS